MIYLTHFPECLRSNISMIADCFYQFSPIFGLCSL